MKKLLLTLSLTVLSVGFTWSQCVPTCSAYAVSPVTFTTFPTGTLNVTPSFTNPVLGTWADDGSTGPIPIGFSFNYFCNTYTNIHICSNGFIMLDYMAFPWPTQYVHPTVSFPSASLPDGIIAFNMTDLDPGVGGSITYTTVGSAPNRMFIVTFSNVPCFSTPSDLNTGQIVLYETTNMIEIHNKKARPDINQGTLGSTQGIENTTGTVGYTPPGRNANNSWGANADNTAYQFSPYTPAPPTSVTGPTLLCQGDNDVYTAAFMVGASSYSWNLPNGFTGSSNNSTLSTQANATGVLSVTATYTCGTSAPTTITVTVVPGPTVSLTSISPNVVCSGNTVAINFTGNASTYTIEPGTLTGTSPLIDTPLATTVYSVTGTNTAGCSSTNTSTLTVIVKDTPTVTVNSGTICQGQSFTITPTGANSYVYSSTFPVVTPVAGNYTYMVTGTGTNGCVGAPAMSQLTVSPIPGVSLISNRATMCVKETVTLTAGGGDSYTWINATSTGSTAVVSPTVGTTFTVTGSNTMGCVKNATVFVNVMPCVGIAENNEAIYMNIYPNPSSGEYFISTEKTSTIAVYDILGKKLFEQKLESGVNKLDLHSYGNGKYLLKSETGDVHRTMVLIKN